MEWNTPQALHTIATLLSQGQGLAEGPTAKREGLRAHQQLSDSLRTTPKAESCFIEGFPPISLRRSPRDFIDLDAGCGLNPTHPVHPSCPLLVLGLTERGSIPGKAPAEPSSWSSTMPSRGPVHHILSLGTSKGPGRRDRVIHFTLILNNPNSQRCLQIWLRGFGGWNT